ncbi:hypothetical protein F511_34366 [Dorcoceras hygrometricum]|uniref:Uncharacterized protein n=1 Tax=Dorcoceras hygrometricum TaxID=472368 RepID=A0A2Z7C6J4_9LAMI|nr:hypothetical protein F511_34366 [Dorcoceras hygrometricum]
MFRFHLEDLSRIVHCVVVSYLVVLRYCFLPGCEGERRYRTLISLLGLLALMRRVISLILLLLFGNLSKLVSNQTRDSRKSGDAHREVMCKINHVERVFLDILAAQNEAFRDYYLSGFFQFILLSEMTSVFITNALKINFDSVLGIQDNDGTVNTFRALEVFGLRGFLGCPSVLYEQELGQFFDTALVQDNDITCVISGKYVAISEDRFAGVFNLPTDGHTDLSEVPNHLAGSFDAVTHERFLMMTAVYFWVKINWSKIIFEVLNEMADRTIRRAKGFAAQIFVLLKGDFVVTLGEAKTFPHLKILCEKTVNTYVATNKTIDARGESDEPHVDEVVIFKRKSVSKKKSAPTDKNDADEEPVEVVEKVVSKKQSPSTVAQDVEPISVVPAERPHKRTAPKRKLRMIAGSDDEIVEKEPAVDIVVVKRKEQTSIDDVDTIIEEVIAATAQLEKYFAEPILGDAMLPSVLAAEPTKIKFGVGIQIPGVTEMDQYKSSLPQIAATDKGKEPPVVGIQWRIRMPFNGAAEIKNCPEKHSIHSTQINKPFIGGSSIVPLLASRRLAPTSFTRKPALQTVGGGRSSIRNHESSTCVTLNGSWIQLAVGPQPLWLRNHNFGLSQRIMVRRLATSCHDPLGITDSACKNQLVMVSVQYGPFNTYIPIRSTTICVRPESVK